MFLPSNVGKLELEETRLSRYNDKTHGAYFFSFFFLFFLDCARHVHVRPNSMWNIEQRFWNRCEWHGFTDSAAKLNAFAIVHAFAGFFCRALRLLPDVFVRYSAIGRFIARERKLLRVKISKICRIFRNEDRGRGRVTLVSSSKLKFIETANVSIKIWRFYLSSMYRMERKVCAIIDKSCTFHLMEIHVKNLPQN